MVRRNDFRNAGRDSPSYLRVRKEALKRDKFKCKKCGSKKNLQVHHIKNWACYPTLREELDNLITLCKRCHLKINRSEEEWAGTCLLLLRGESGLDINYMLWKARQPESAESEQEEEGGDDGGTD